MQGEQALGVGVRITIKKLHPILFQNPFLGFQLSVLWSNKTAGVSEEILNGIVIVIVIVIVLLLNFNFFFCELLTSVGLVNKNECKDQH